MTGEGKFIDGLMQGNVRVDGDVQADSVIARGRSSNHILERFDVLPICVGTAGTAATGTAAYHNRLEDNGSG